MSEETPPEQTLEPAKKRRVKYNFALAILAVHERKKLGHHVDYKALSERFQIPINSLRSTYCLWTQGKIDLGMVERQPEDLALDSRTQHSKTLELVNRHVNLLLVHYEAAIYYAEDNLSPRGKGASKRFIPKKPMDQKGELVFISREIGKLLNLRKISEEGYNSALEESRQPMRKAAEKDVNPAHPAPIEVQTHVITATDEQRAVQALLAANAQREAKEIASE